MFKNTAVMMHMGNMTKVSMLIKVVFKSCLNPQDFVPVGQDMQAELKDKTNAEKVVDNFWILVFDSSVLKVGELLGIDTEWMCQYFCKPKLKVGLNFNSIAKFHCRLGRSGSRKATLARTLPTPLPVLLVPSTSEPSGSVQRSVTRPSTVRFQYNHHDYKYSF